MRLIPPLLLVAALLVVPQMSAAQNRYDQCLQEVREQPEEALARAERWRQEGGGVASRHCAAAALAELGRYGEAANHLRAVADAVDPASKPSLLGELAWLWMLEGQPQRAEAVQSEGLEIAPDDVELRIDRAITRADQGRWWDAIDDLDHASGLAPERMEVLILRSEAYRRVEAPELALEDLERALTSQPDNAEALMHRGIVRFELGDSEGAAEDWRRVVELDPEGEAGSVAARNLERLEHSQDD